MCVPNKVDSDFHINFPHCQPWVQQCQVGPQHGKTQQCSLVAARKCINVIKCYYKCYFLSDPDGLPETTGPQVKNPCTKGSFGVCDPSTLGGARYPPIYTTSRLTNVVLQLKKKKKKKPLFVKVKFFSPNLTNLLQ